MFHHKLPQSFDPEGLCCPLKPGRWQCDFPPWRRWRTSLHRGSQQAGKQRDRRTDCDLWICLAIDKLHGGETERGLPLFCYETTSNKWLCPHCWGVTLSWGLLLCSWQPQRELRAGSLQVDLRGNIKKKTKKKTRTMTESCCHVAQISDRSPELSHILAQ